MQQIHALLAFVAGVFIPCFYWSKPDYLPLLFASAVLACAYYRFRRIWMITFLAGLTYGHVAAVSFDQLLLPDSLNNQAFLVQGELVGLPEQGGRVWRFNLQTQSLQPVSDSSGEPLPKPTAERKLRLSFYGQPDQVFRPGDQLVFEARLRRPHGLMNPGLFDYQRWLVSESISSTGYISNLIEHKTSESPGVTSMLDHWRQVKSGQLQRAGVPRADIQSALTLGDRQYVDAATWDLFVDTGVVHLMVISGLHVGFVAGMAYWLSRWILSIVLLPARPNSHRWANLAAILAACIYAGLAGFSAPTMRAMIMLCALLLPRFFFLNTSPWWGLSLALAVIAALDPRAVLQSGFWLSFLAVALIFLSLKTGEHEGLWRGLIRIQLIFLVGFSGVILLVQGQLNPLAFIANLVAVPLVSLLVVPMEIFGLLASLVSTNASLFFWGMAGHLLDFLVFVLTWISELSEWRLQRQPLPFWLMVFPAAAGLTLFYWKKWWQKAIALILMLLMVVPIDHETFFLEVRVFDVGQGLAVLVRQPGYSLLYDTGPKFSDAFDAGADILLPSFRQLGMDSLDDVIVSHPDADHLGGYAGLAKGMNIGTTRAGRWSGKTAEAKACLAGQSWHVGSVTYRILSPTVKDPGPDVQVDNDRSCVLQIQFGDQSLLLPGDIGWSVERGMLARYQLGKQVLVVIPHHGSKSSSSPEFVRAIRPGIAIASAGYLNRFGHPVPEVLARYQQQGSRVMSTSESGMIRVLWRDGPEAVPEIETEAKRRIFWWQK